MRTHAMTAVNHNKDEETCTTITTGYSSTLYGATWRELPRLLRGRTQLATDETWADHHCHDRRRDARLRIPAHKMRAGRWPALFPGTHCPSRYRAVPTSLPARSCMASATRSSSSSTTRRMMRRLTPPAQHPPHDLRHRRANRRLPDHHGHPPDRREQRQRGRPPRLLRGSVASGGGDRGEPSRGGSPRESPRHRIPDDLERPPMAAAIPPRDHRSWHG